MGSLQLNDSILEYGFTIRSASGDRTLVPNELGVVTLGFRVPLQTVVTDTPRRFRTTFTYATDAITRVTRDKSETTAQVVARTGAPVNASEVVLVGSDTDVAGNGLNTIRLLSIKTFANPAPAPVTGTLGTAGGTVALGQARIEVPSGAVPANTTLSIERLNALPTPLPTTEELGRVSDARLVSAYRIRSSVKTFQDYVKFVIPINVIATLPSDQLTTELYVWDGVKYDKVRIGNDDRSFEYSTYTMPGTGGGSPTYFIDFLAVRAPTSSVASACTSSGGVWNGIYCEGGSGAGTFSQPRDTTIIRKTLSINVGNADIVACPLYLFKLCGYAAEQKISRYIAAQNADIIALQEVWHDQCFFQDTGDRDRVCSFPFRIPLKPKQIERLVNTGVYDYRCSPTVTFANEPANSNKKIVNGFECIAVRKTLFEFTTAIGSSPATIQPACETSAAGVYYKGSDTGAQVETIRPKTFTYVDPFTPTNLSLAQQVVQFDVVNAHFVGEPIPGFQGCNDMQWDATSKRYFDLRPGLIRPLAKRVLLMGDFNRVHSDIPAFQTFAPLGLSIDQLIIEPTSATDKNRKIAYLLSDPTQQTATFVNTFGLGLDHVASNFLERSGLGCVVGLRVANMDHMPTLCSVKGFDGGWGRVLVQVNQNIAGTISQFPEQNFIAARRRGVELTYVRTLQYNTTSGLHTFIGLSDAGPVKLELRRCRVTGAIGRELDAEVSPGGGVGYPPQLYPSAPVCN